MKDPPAIIIPITDIRPHNRQDLIELLDCIKPDADKYKMVICCFDGCKEEFVEFFQEKYPFIESIWNKGKALGFTRNSNLGLSFVKDKLNTGTFLINQDCIIPRFEVMKGLIRDGLSTPVSVDFIKTQEELTDYPKTVMVNSPVSKLSKNHFAFFCPYFSPGLLKEVGVLDGAFPNIFSDDDYCLRTLLNGRFPVEVVNTAAVYHKGTHIDMSKTGESHSGTYTGGDLPLGLCQYRLKWSVPANVEHHNIIEWVLKNHKWDGSMSLG